ncbi:MAG: squalene/phytoene synthase family protein, partial [Verrucomicrobiota bacterium]
MPRLGVVAQASCLWGDRASRPVNQVYREQRPCTLRIINTGQDARCPHRQDACATIRRVNAEKITRQSKSNLALAFVALGPERRRDITIFYAFCRVIDDIADSPSLS